MDNIQTADAYSQHFDNDADEGETGGRSPISQKQVLLLLLLLLLLQLDSRRTHQ
jgi:hypothetical protein